MTERQEKQDQLDSELARSILLVLSRFPKIIDEHLKKDADRVAKLIESRIEENNNRTAEPGEGRPLAHSHLNLLKEVDAIKLLFLLWQQHRVLEAAMGSLNPQLREEQKYQSLISLMRFNRNRFATTLQSESVDCRLDTKSVKNKYRKRATRIVNALVDYKLAQEIVAPNSETKWIVLSLRGLVVLSAALNSKLKTENISLPSFEVYPEHKVGTA